MIKNLKAITLMELLITVSVVGIIMLGVTSMDISIRKQSNSITNTNLSVLYGQTMIDHVITNAQKMDRESWAFIGSGIANFHTFCFKTVGYDSFICYSLNALEFVTCSKLSADRCAAVDTGYTVLGNVYSAGIADMNNLASAVYVNLGYDKNVGSQNALFTIRIKTPDSSSVSGFRTFVGSVTPIQSRL